MAKRAQALKQPGIEVSLPKTLGSIDLEWLGSAEKESLARVFDIRISAHKKPELKGLVEAKTVDVVIENPYSPTRAKDTQKRSLRDDPLADMLARGVIDQALYLAGRKWQALHERSTIGSIGAIDPTKEAVDGGRMPDPITDRQIEAFRELAVADKRLGQWGGVLIRNLLADRMTVGQMCELHDCKTGRRMNFLSMRVRECLEDLGKLWGFVG